MIVIAPYVLHRHRLWWKGPELFDPARFLPSARASIEGRARGCIGSVFAQQEALIALAAIIREFELDVAPGHAVWPLHRITLRPRRGLPMIVRPRSRGTVKTH
jgi:cytochrome P450